MTPARNGPELAPIRCNAALAATWENLVATPCAVRLNLMVLNHQMRRSEPRRERFVNMPNRDDIAVDHDEIREHTMKLEGMASELQDTILGLPQILEVMERDAGRGTASGAPAPIFVPVIEAAKTALGNVGTSLYAIHEKIIHDIEILRAASDDAQLNDELGAQSIYAIDPDFLASGAPTTQLTSAGGGVGSPTQIQPKVATMAVDPATGEFTDTGLVDPIEAAPRLPSGVETRERSMVIDPATGQWKDAPK